jgi:hypothetical protein
LRVLDLCSGLGGASAAFKDRGHEVVTVDVERKFRPTILADVRYFHGLEGSFDVVLAAPPCQGFSTASLGVHWKYGPDRVAQEGLKIVLACFRIIREIKPRFYVLENPRGMLRSCIGLPTETVFYCSYGAEFQKPTDLWHNLPIRLKLPCAPHRSGHYRLGGPGTGHRDPAKRALWPYNLSLTICKVCESP